jgi:hypothetical protein
MAELELEENYIERHYAEERRRQRDYDRRFRKYPNMHRGLLFEADRKEPELKLRKAVNRALERLSMKNRTARKTGSVDDRYYYLWRVYRISQQFAQHSKPESIAWILGRNSETRPLDLPWFIGRVLFRTSNDDRRLRSKYAGALTYAAAKHVEPENVATFIQSKGGFNACVERLRRRRRKGLC